MRRVGRKLVSVLLALAMVVLCLPEYVKPVNKAVAAEAAPTETIYVLTNELLAGEKYLIVGANAVGKTNALSHDETSVMTNEVTIHAASENDFTDQVFIKSEEVAATSVWSTDVDQNDQLMRLQNQQNDINYFLQVEGGDSVITITNGPDDQGPYSLFNWSYLQESHALRLTYHSTNAGGGNRTRYIQYSNGTFSGTTSGTHPVYIFVEQVNTLCAHTYDVSMDWTVGDTSATAVATYKCSKCNDTAVIHASVVRSDVEGDCLTAPQWKFTATVSAADSPAGVEYSESKTVVQKVADPSHNVTKTAYILVDTVTVGKKYLVVNANKKGAAHALANGAPNRLQGNSYVVADSSVDIQEGDVTINGTTSAKAFILGPASSAVWAYSSTTSNGTVYYQFANTYRYQTYYLFHRSGNNSYIYTSSTGQPNYRGWIAGGDTLTYEGDENTYYVLYNNSNSNHWQDLPSVAIGSEALGHVYYFEEVQNVTIPGYTEAKASGHPKDKFNHFDATPASCTVDGNNEYWYCEACGNYYNNSDGAEAHKINAEDVVIKAEHEWVFGGFTWSGNDVAGYDKVTAAFTCTKTQGETHTPDPAVTVALSSEEFNKTDDEPAKIVYTALISEENSPDKQEHKETKTIYRYKITFLDDLGNEIPNSAVIVNAGTLPSGIPTPEITKEATDQYTYTFSGWSPQLQKVTENAEYTATFSATTNAYEITFVNRDDEVLQQGSVEYDKMPVYSGVTPSITPTVEKVFTFIGWSPEIAKVTGKKTYTAQYSEAPRKYTITFVVDGQTFGGAVEYGATPSYDGTPSKTGVDKNYRYVFIGWQDKSGQIYDPDDDLPSVEEDQTYTAVFETQYYVDFASMTGGKVLFADDSDGYFPENAEVRLVVSDEDDDENNIDYEYVPDSLTVSKSQGTVAVSAGGDGVLIFTMPAEKVTVDAKFTRVYFIWIGEVQVTDENMDNVLGDDSVSCEYADGKWTMKFTEATELTMSEELPALIIYFEREPLTIVTPKDGLTLESDDAVVGIFCPDTDLTIEGDLAITLKGQILPDGVIRGANGIAALNATFKGNLSIVVDPETTEDEGDLEDMIGGIAGEEIVFDSGIDKVDITLPKGGIAIVAWSDIVIPETHGIKIPENGTIGTYVLFESDNSIGDVAVEDITAKTILTADDSAANIVSIRKLAHVKFENDGEVLFEDDFFVGDVPEVKLEKEPEKEKDKQYTYEYAGWKDENGEYPKDGDLPELTGDTTFTAYFKGILNKYKVTFVDEDGTVLKAATEYEFGTKAADIAKPADPTKAATAEKTYGFGGWSPALADVTGDVTYTATYVDANAKYKVTFVDEDGTELKAATEYAYGTKAADIAKPADPTKAEDEKYTYEFSGWSPEISDVINNATYKATYKATEKQEKGVYQYVGPAELTYTKGSGKGFVFTFKRTKNDELTKERFRKFLRNNADIDAKWLKITYGSVIIEVSSEYLDSLPEGRNEFTATFEDGDPVSVALTILPAQSSEEQTSPDSPKTADTMFVLWLALILGIATVTVAVMIKKREKDEEIGL